MNEAHLHQKYQLPRFTTGSPDDYSFAPGTGRPDSALRIDEWLDRWFMTISKPPRCRHIHWAV